MKRILHLNSSIQGSQSYSIKLSKAIVEKIQEKYPDSTVKEVNLVDLNIPHLDADIHQSFFTPKDQLTDEQKKSIKFSDEALEQVFAADVIVIGAPLYNFTIHTALKAWIDHITRLGKTFRYIEHGAEGLVKGKKVYIAMSSGAIYSEGQWQPYDFVSPYLKAILGFIGMTDLTIFRVEGVSIPGIKEKALEKALESINI